MNCIFSASFNLFLLLSSLFQALTYSLYFSQLVNFSMKFFCFFFLPSPSLSISLTLCPCCPLLATSHCGTSDQHTSFYLQKHWLSFPKHCLWECFIKFSCNFITVTNLQMPTRTQVPPTLWLIETGCFIPSLFANKIRQLLLYEIFACFPTCERF